MRKMRIGLVNHGCPKNLVDAELMLGALSQRGYGITLDCSHADIVIINTCSFIQDAEKESVKSIIEMIDEGKKIIITGCLPQKHKNELLEAIPESLAFVGTTDLAKIVEVVDKIAGGFDKTIYEVTDTPNYVYPEDIERQQITVGSSSYIKIADGCDYKCGYCVIPELRGAYRSRTIEAIVGEAKKLGNKGVSEIILIAQDTTSYGKDIYGKPTLAKLLTELNKVEEISWIRVLYVFPSMMNDEVIDAFANLDKVVKYVDIPLQHSHPEMLKLMNRPAFDNSALIQKLRDRIKGVTLRTAFIVGYPGETEEHFEHLYNFIEKNRFDKLGVFEYSKEKTTISYALRPHILAKVKKSRRKAIMKLQQKISKEINESFIGKEIPTIIESISSSGEIIGRTYRDAPDIDGLMYIETDKHLVPGDIEMVKVTKATEYDLFGCVAAEPLCMI